MDVFQDFARCRQSVDAPLWRGAVVAPGNRRENRNEDRVCRYGCAWSAMEPCEAFQDHGLERPYPWIIEGARKNPAEAVYLDGEAVVLGVDETSDSAPCTHASTMRRSDYMPAPRMLHALCSRKVLMRNLTFQPEVHIYNLPPWFRSLELY
jgi:hypothetical protein